MPPSNEAAWLPSHASALEVTSAPYTHPAEHEIVIKNAAVAINPADWVEQALAPIPLSYPAILGHDTAGIVEEVGSAVTRFKAGDRVLGHACGLVTKRDCENAFQRYTVVPDNMASPIPASISFEAASVIPAGFTTAACGLYEKGFLALQYPSVHPNPTGQVLLVWAGSTSVGSNAIQLGVASGYEVFATASSKNFEYVKKLGAVQVFDHHSDTVVDDLVSRLKGKVVAGAIDCIGKNGTELCGQVLGKCEGTRKIATVLSPQNEEMPGGVKVKMIYCLSIMNNEVSKIAYEDYLPKALEAGTFVPAPKCEVVGSGLDAIQHGMNTLKEGVSATKIVIKL